MGVVPSVLDFFGFDCAEQNKLSVTEFQFNRAKRPVTLGFVK
jgi:hypothetical protein